MSFVLDHRLQESSIFIADWPLCRICLKNDKTYPWLYLVPRRENIREIYDLTAEDQAILVQEIARAGQALSRHTKAAKINTAALGNMVPQLHVHIFARFENDPAWPKPVWVVPTPEIPYTEAESATMIAALKKGFGS